MFCVSISIIIFFITLEIRYPINVISFFLLFRDINGIVTNGHGLFFSLSNIILFVFLGFFLLIFFALFQKLYYIGAQ